MLKKYTKSDFDKLKTPSDLLKYMDNIKYGFVSKNGRKYFDQNEEWGRDWYGKCIVQSAEGLLKTNRGTCWDQVELERKWFQEHDYQFKTIFSWFETSEPNNYPTHTFLAFKENYKWYWFEHSFGIHKGIHKYKSLDELIKNVKSKQLESAINSGIATAKDKKLLKSYEYKKPKANLGVKDYLNHVLKAPNSSTKGCQDTFVQ